MGADLFFSDDVCVGNLKETKETKVRLIIQDLDMCLYTIVHFFLYAVQSSEPLIVLCFVHHFKIIMAPK